MGSIRKIKHLSIPLSDNCIDGLLSQCTEVRTTELSARGIYMTNIALVVHLYWSFDGSAGTGEQGSATSSSIFEDDIKRSIGRFLRLLSGYAEQAGFSLPVIGIVEVDKKNISIIEQWASDQDWHRGDFSLFPATKNKLEEMSQALLLGTTKAWEHIEPIAPLTSKQYLTKLEDEHRVSKVSVEHDSLLCTIEAAWREASSIDEAVKQWLEQQLQDAESLITGG